MEAIHRRNFSEPDRAEVQDDVIAAVLADPDRFINAYKANPDNFGGRYVCADSFKDTFAQFSQSPEARNRYNTPVHNAAAVLASEQFRRVIHDESDPVRDAAIFVTGIPGAGKSSAVVGAGLPRSARVIYEGQLNRPEPTMAKIQEALDLGLHPHIVAVHVTPELALRRTFQRFNEYGRGASLAVMSDIQAGLPSGLAKVHQHFGDRVNLTILDNRIPGEHKMLEGWQHLKLLTQEGNHERISQRLRAELERHQREGRISDACYRQANGDAPLPPSPALAQKSHPRYQRHDAERAATPGGREANEIGRDERPARAVAFEQMPEADALVKHPELQGAIRELAAGRTEAARLYPSDYRQRDSHIASVRNDIQRRLDDGRIPPLPPRSGSIANTDRER